MSTRTHTRKMCVRRAEGYIGQTKKDPTFCEDASVQNNEKANMVVMCIKMYIRYCACLNTANIAGHLKGYVAIYE